MFIILRLLFGALIGWIASLFTSNNHRMGIIANIIVGLVGAFIGGYISSALGFVSINVFSWQGILFSVIGSVILLTVINIFRKKR